MSSDRLPLARVSTTDAIVNELRSQILDGTLEPGTHLREIELSEPFGVSRQSLRAALAELVRLGLLRRVEQGLRPAVSAFATGRP